MITPDLGNGVGFIYVTVAPFSPVVLPNIPASFARLGSLYVSTPTGVFALWASLSAMPAPLFIPQESVQIVLADLQTAAKTNLLEIS